MQLLLLDYYYFFIKFLVKINAYQYRAEFEVMAEDNAESIENSIVDKLGEKSIKWDTTGFYDTRKKWITYEEVINDPRPVQTEKVLGVELGARTP